MTVPNGRVLMGDAISPPALSPTTFSPTKNSMTASTLNDASLDELDRIMDTLSTLSRDTSGPKRGVGFSTPSSGQRSYPTTESGTGSDSTTPYSATSPSRGFPITQLEYLPPPMTSPPQTPVAQSPRHFTAQPKVMTISGMPSYHPIAHATEHSEARNPATVPRLPSNPYENTSILHGSHMVRQSSVTSAQNPSYYTTNIPDSPYVNKHTPVIKEGQFFFGPLPVSPQNERYPPTGPKPPSMLPSSSSAYSQNEQMTSQLHNNREEVESTRSNPKATSSRKQNSTRSQNNVSLTLPAYNEKKSYLKNLEQGTLPRPRIESSQQQIEPQNGTPQLSRKLSRPNKTNLSEEVGGSLNRLSLRKRRDKGTDRSSNRLGLQNLSKTPSRHSTASFNSCDFGGRGYASVSTAPASTHGLIHHEVLPHGMKKNAILSPESSQSACNDGEDEDENCCIRCGRFLHSHLLELLILVAFCAGFPIGIVLQATGYHATASFEKYYTFWGSNLLPAVLSTITPMLIISSMLTGMSNLTTDVLKRLTIVLFLYYLISSVVAVSIALAFSMIIKPGNFAVNSDPTNISTYENSTNGTKNFAWPNPKILIEKGILKDDGISVFATNEENLFYNTSEVENITISDEILTLVRLFFPGCGYPNKQDSGICNVFVLVLFAGVIGVGASSMGAKGGPIRHVVSQIGTVMSNMADLILWYVPIGVLFYVSEMVATRIDWENIGNTRPLSTFLDENSTSAQDDVTSLNNATTWFLITVVLSLGIYCLILMPLVVSVMTLSNPFTLIGFRSIGPLLTATVTGFSDICIPLTVRCLLKRKGTSRCCTPQDKIDRRVARVSGVTGGIFHRGGSAIVIVCSTVFLLQIKNEQQTAIGTILLCVSAMATSVTSLGGRWFSGTSGLMRAMVISLTTAEYEYPLTIPQTVFGLWFISRFAAFADTIVDLFGAQLLHKACKSGIRDITAKDKTTEKSETGCDDNVERKACDRATVNTNKSPLVRSMGGETSDYEDVPLLFSRKNDAGNEFSSMNSRNDDSVFLPNRPQEAHTSRHIHNEELHNNVRLNGHSVPPPVVPNCISRTTEHDAGHRQINQCGVSNPVLGSKDEISFVTF